MVRCEWVKGLLVGCKVKANCSLVGPGLTGGVPFVGVFLRDPSPYLSKFRRKPRKTRNGLVDKSDQGLNLASPIFQFWAFIAGKYINPWLTFKWLEAKILSYFLSFFIYLFWKKDTTLVSQKSESMPKGMWWMCLWEIKMPDINMSVWALLSN